MKKHTFKFPNGIKYVGEIKNNKFNGQGALTFPGTGKKSGKYVGEFKNGNYYGQGTLTSGENKYVGEFKNGKSHGQGVMTYPDGKIEKGIWKN